MMFALTDTNVFIHYEFFKNVDWAEELGAREVTLVIPPVVLEELDKRKWAGTRREKERAKTVPACAQGAGPLDSAGSDTPWRFHHGTR